jgi:hypothetical protein
MITESTQHEPAANEIKIIKKNIKNIKNLQIFCQLI